MFIKQQFFRKMHRYTPLFYQQTAVIFFRHCYNTGGESSTQRERFCTRCLPIDNVRSTVLTLIGF